MNIYAEALMLWLVMDSVGNIPVFAAILSGIPHSRRKKNHSSRVAVCFAYPFYIFLWRQLYFKRHATV
ncbi:MAG: hypothetical protein LRY69_01155 [Gammaproteobacteria bacterium]|nr:hypothetical protein [Gammaproteobacteria bacterium]